MRFSTATVTAFAALAIAAPTPNRALRARQNGPVLADTTYDAISISGGTAGNGEAEALAVFSALDLNNPGNIDPADVAFLGAVNDVANDAETDAFNTAIAAATGDEKAALEAGKTKNKILKLMATKIELEAKAAQGEDVAAKQAEENTKLQNNIDADVARAGEASTAASFTATISGGGNVAAAGNNNNNAATGNNNNNNNNAATGNNNNNNNANGDDEEDAANDNNAATGNNNNAATGNNNNNGNGNGNGNNNNNNANAGNNGNGNNQNNAATGNGNGNGNANANGNGNGGNGNQNANANNNNNNDDDDDDN